MKITIGNEGRYNFHNMPDIDINVKAENYIYRDGEIEAVKITPSQIKRIGKHFCGISDCLCGSHPKGWEAIDYDRAIIHLGR